MRKDEINGTKLPGISGGYSWDHDFEGEGGV